MVESKEQELWQTCTDGDLETVKKWASDPAVNVNWGDPEHGRTPFYRACGHGRGDVVEYLMESTGGRRETSSPRRVPLLHCVSGGPQGGGFPAVGGSKT